jgi:hypothetical protein
MNGREVIYLVLVFGGSEIAWNRRASQPNDSYKDNATRRGLFESIEHLRKIENKS